MTTTYRVLAALVFAAFHLSDAIAQNGSVEWRLIREPENAYFFSVIGNEGGPVGLYRSYACQKGGPTIEARVYYNRNDGSSDDDPSMGKRTRGCDALCQRFYIKGFRDEIKNRTAPGRPVAFRTKQMKPKAALSDLRIELSEPSQFGDVLKPELDAGLRHNRAMLSMFRQTCEIK